MRRAKVARSPIKCSAAELVATRFRQIHLDFHTSEHIPDVGARFDADEFAGTLADARVNWVTLFAKCHHGLSYYPTTVGNGHPSLKFDLLGEQVEACRKRGIVTPAYISVRVDENHARLNSDWIGRLKDNKPWKWAETLTAGWYNHCLNNPAYVEELETQAVEVLKWYDVEGLFFDMCYTAEPGCYCPRCYDSMKKKGLDFTSDEDHRKHEYMVTREYTRRLTRAVKSVRRNATIFYNGRVNPYFKPELDIMTHVEIEALPTGGWGYAYFPIHSRYARNVGLPLQGMTARFHKAWADFGGLKSADMLTYEAGTILAAGGVMNVGDQLHPRGTLDRGAYEVIGETFRHVEACEPWCHGAKPVTEVAVMMLPSSLSAAKDDDGNWTTGRTLLGPSADGAGRMLLELKQQFDIIYTDSDLAGYRTVILPDAGYVPPHTAKALAAFVKDGGSLIVSHKAGWNGKGFDLPGVPIKALGPNPFKPCYMALGRELGRGLPDSDYVFYEDSMLVRPVAGAKSLGRLVDSYFNRAYDRFCSHNQTPSDKPTGHPVAVVKGRVAYVAPAVFQAYREHAFPLYKKIVGRILDMVMRDPLIRVAAPSAMEVSLSAQHRERRLVAHMVNFQPQRRHTQVEWIEDLYPVSNLQLAVRTVKTPSMVYLAPQGEPLPFAMEGDYCRVTVPSVKAHQLVVFDDVAIRPGR